MTAQVSPTDIGLASCPYTETMLLSSSLKVRGSLNRALGKLCWRDGCGAVGMCVVVQSFGPSTQAHTGRETVEFEASLFRAFQTRQGNMAGGGGGRKKDKLCI